MSSRTRDSADFVLGWSVVWDRPCRAARLLELYGGLEAEWTIGVWFKGIVRLFKSVGIA